MQVMEGVIFQRQYREMQADRVEVPRKEQINLFPRDPSKKLQMA
jgi:hypothetical protein